MRDLHVRRIINSINYQIERMTGKIYCERKAIHQHFFNVKYTYILNVNPACQPPELERCSTLATYVKKTAHTKPFMLGGIYLYFFYFIYTTCRCWGERKSFWPRAVWSSLHKSESTGTGILFQQNLNLTNFKKKNKKKLWNQWMSMRFRSWTYSRLHYWNTKNPEVQTVEVEVPSLQQN